MASVIEFDRLSYSHPGASAPVIQDLSLDIEAGSFVAIVGGSGSGKTTLLRLANRLIEADEGHITVEGEDVRATDPVDGAINEQHQMEAELARQRTQLAELQRQQSDLTASLAGITGDLAAVGLQIEQAAREIDEASLRLEEARSELQASSTSCPTSR